jgi:hypothetical protein
MSKTIQFACGHKEDVSPRYDWDTSRKCPYCEGRERLEAERAGKQLADKAVAFTSWLDSPIRRCNDCRIHGHCSQVSCMHHVGRAVWKAWQQAQRPQADQAAIDLRHLDDDSGVSDG